MIFLYFLTFFSSDIFHCELISAFCPAVIGAAHQQRRKAAFQQLYPSVNQALNRGINSCQHTVSFPSLFTIETNLMIGSLVHS